MLLHPTTPCVSACGLWLTGVRGGCGPLQPPVKCPIGLLGWNVGIGPRAGPVMEESTQVAREYAVKRSISDRITSVCVRLESAANWPAQVVAVRPRKPRRRAMAPNPRSAANKRIGSDRVEPPYPKTISASVTLRTAGMVICTGGYLYQLVRAARTLLGVGARLRCT